MQTSRAAMAHVALALAASLLAVGCGAEASSRADASEASDGLVTMNFDDTEAALILRALGMVLDQPVKIDPEAQPLVDCTVVTVHAGRGSRAAGASAVISALREKGLVVSVGAGAIEVRRAAVAPACPKKR
jgi:type II secretory pathway component GspD/PulD (secretin)